MNLFCDFNEEELRESGEVENVMFVKHTAHAGRKKKGR